MCFSFCFFFLPQVFSRANVYFSLGGRQFSNNPVYYSYIPDLLMEHARNVTIKLHHRLGRFVKLQLYFANRWLLLSEVKFDSGKQILNLFSGFHLLHVRLPHFYCVLQINACKPFEADRSVRYTYIQSFEVQRSIATKSILHFTGLPQLKK